MKLLVPVLTKKEANPFFVEEILSLKPAEVILLSVIDSKKESNNFGFSSNEIALANSIMNELEKQLKEKKMRTEPVLEWGETIQKIVNSALLFKAKKVLLIENELPETIQLIDELNSKKINALKVAFKEPEPVKEENYALKEIAEQVKKEPELTEETPRKTISKEHKKTTEKENEPKKEEKKKSFLEMLGLK
ncbi:MAG: hypothetical protein JW703_03775 [Candidatus Diapherotrites archaeon]|nr:hypothetical protein [Candidatus Diapherotrites archaeon]